MSEGIPKFDNFLAPILRLCKDKNEHDLSETIDVMSNEFKLSEDDKNTLMPNGNRTYLYDRVAWAVTYLVQSGLLMRTGRSKLKISDLGVSELPLLPEKISYKYLEKFPAYHEFKVLRHRKKQQESDAQANTPDEEIDDLFKSKNKTLATNLLSSISNIKSSDFERLVIDLAVSLGYGKSYEEMTKVLGKSGDNGIDGEISQDKLGFDKIYLQAKKWDTKNSVSSSQIRDFIGALTIKHAQKGLFITTTSFSREAIETAHKDTTHTVILIDGGELTTLMIEYGIGVRKVKTYDSKEIDTDYFESF